MRHQHPNDLILAALIAGARDLLPAWQDRAYSSVVWCAATTSASRGDAGAEADV